MDDTSAPGADTASAPAAAGGAPPVTPSAPPETPAPSPNGRRKSGTVAVAIVAALGIAALGIAGWMYYQTTTAQRAAVERLEEATALVESADAVVLDLDEVVRAEISSEIATPVAGVAEALPGAVEELEEAIVLIDECVEDLPDDEIAYARALRDSASARLDMFEQAEPILDANAQAAAALGPAKRGWELVLEANTLSRDAVAEYNKLTRESVTRSARLTRESEAKVREAKDLFSVAATSFPEADLSMYLDHCDAKIAALQISKKADEAYLANQPAQANTLSGQFNAAEKALATQAAELPASPAQPIATAYQDLAGEATALYFQARARATEADARLREADGRNGSVEGG